MVVESVFLFMALVLGIGFLGEVIFARTKIPDVIWLIVIGIIVGPILAWVQPTMLEDIAPFFTTFALIFLLFEAGINIDIRSFIKSAPQGLKLSITGFVLSFIVSFSILVFFMGVAPALLAGSILAGLSSAVVIPIIKSISLRPQTKLALVFDSALSDVLCILGTVTIIEIFTTGGVTATDVVSGILTSFLIAIALGAATAYLWVYLLQHVKDHRFVLTLAAMLTVYAISQMLKGNGAIAALVFGLVLGNTKKIAAVFNKESTYNMTRSGKEFFSEIAFFIKTFFFVYLGILMSFSEPLSFVWAFVILAGMFLVRPLAVWVAFGKETPLQDIKVAETLIPKGLAAAVLVQLAINANIPGTEPLVNITLGVILLSIIGSSVFVYLIQKNKYPGIFQSLYKRSK